MMTLLGMALGGWMSGVILIHRFLPCRLRKRRRVERLEIF